MDILPAQGSSVSSERVFSSARDTLTDARVRMGPHSLECRQILKYILRAKRLSLQGRWNMSPIEVAAATVANELEAAWRARDTETLDRLNLEIQTS